MRWSTPPRRLGLEVEPEKGGPMRRSRVVGTVALAVLVLAGCGDVNPGAAATVDGEVIPLSEVDAMARAFCAADVATAELQGQEPSPRPTADYRIRVLNTLVDGELADIAVDELGLDVPPSAYGQDLSQFDDLFAELSDAEADALRDYIEAFGRLQASIAAIGRDQGSADAEPEAATAAGTKYLASLADETDIELDPRFGDMASGQVVGGSGSLSVPSAAEEETGAAAGADGGDVDDLPETQVCS